MSCAICTRHHPNDDGECTKGCRHRETDQGLLCGPCAQRIRDDLDVIVWAWQETEEPPTLTVGGSGRSNEPVLPGSCDWFEWRSGRPVMDVCASWARDWHECLQETDPTLLWPAQTVEAVVGFLRQHLDTFGVGHPAIDDFARELAPVARYARRLIGDVPSGQVILCPGLAGPCGRRLRIDMADLDATVKCRGCETEWTAGRLILNAADSDGYADAEAIEAVLRIPQSTLRRWARAGIVDRRGQCYSISDAQAVRTRTTRGLVVASG